MIFKMTSSQKCILAIEEVLLFDNFFLFVELFENIQHFIKKRFKIYFIEIINFNDGLMFG